MRREFAACTSTSSNSASARAAGPDGPALRTGLAKGIEVLMHGLFEPDEERVADERVPNRDFVQVRQAPEEGQVPQVEIVAGVHTEPGRVRKLGRGRVGCEARLAAPAFELPRERFGI